MNNSPKIFLAHATPTHAALRVPILCRGIPSTRSDQTPIPGAEQLLLGLAPNLPWRTWCRSLCWQQSPTGTLQAGGPK